MASTYTPAELFGSGSLLKENFTAGTPYTITITDKNITGAAYLFLQTKPHNPALPYYLSGSTITATNGGGVIIEPYQAGMVINTTGTTEFVWTPGVNVVGSNVYISATGYVGASIA